MGVEGSRVWEMRRAKVWWGVRDRRGCGGGWVGGNGSGGMEKVVGVRGDGLVEGGMRRGSGRAGVYVEKQE